MGPAPTLFHQNTAMRMHQCLAADYQIVRMLPYIVGIGAIVAGLLYVYWNREPKLPNFDLQKRWGFGTEPNDEDKSIRPFKIEFEDTAIQDLKQRLKNRRPLTKPLEGIQSEYGMNTDYLQTVLEYWTEKYDIKKRVKHLNRIPHYKTRIQGLDIHFMRLKPETKDGVNVLPLLMLHGWPSSSKEFEKVIPLLTTPKQGYDFVFEVIAADLPGYGFSQGSTKPGLNPVQIGIIMRNLMKRLGFDQYYIQAGDWGSVCASQMVTLFQDEILGYHTNMPVSSRKISIIKLLLGSLYPSFVDSVYAHKTYPLKKWFSYFIRESGYYHLQATKPDTVGVALTDSPAGLAAYLMEKIAVCSNRDQLDTPHGGLDSLELDDVLDTVTIMWMNNCAVTSMRLYAEGFHADVHKLTEIQTTVPLAAIKFEHEVMHTPDWMLKDKFLNLVRSTTLDFGGHFAALQTPQVLVDDLFAAANEFVKFHKQNKDINKT